jgi:predicted AAA+ superfamily ATPase
MKIDRIMRQKMPCPKSDPKAESMVFIAGPRQVGKTFLTRQTNFPYFNWDTVETKKAFLKEPYFFRTGAPWVIFDEIHKRRDWKKLLKGYFDSEQRRENFIVTGSGRFSLSQKGGDSLQGRYDLYHLFPVSYREFCGLPAGYQLTAPTFSQFEPQSRFEAGADLLQFGGFPEPLVRGQRAFLNKWQDLYLRRLVQEDIRDFSRVVELDKIELLARILPERVRAPISHKALSEDLDVSRDAIKNWLRLFETLYLGFSLPPWTRKIHRAVKKERKWFFFQWTFCEDPASRFENYVATQLYSLCQLWRDSGLGIYELYYLRDQDRREVDFVITKSLKPVAFIEARVSETSWQSGLDYYARKLDVPSFIVTESGPTRRVADNKWILPFAQFLNSIS